MKTEAKIQQDCVRWFRNNYQRKGVEKGLIFSVPNERSGGFMAVRDLILTGLLSGVSDLVIVLPGKVLFIELKNAKGVQSKSQKRFQYLVEKLFFPYYLIRSFDEFEKIILSEYQGIKLKK